MTQYDDTEASVASGAPLEGYEFIGTTTTYRYTPAAQNQDIAGFTFETLPGIDRGGIKSGSQNDDGLDMAIEMPVDTPLIQDYAFDSALPDLTFTLYRVHRGDNPLTEFVKYWVGEATNFTVDGGVGKCRVPNIFTVVMGVQIPNVYYMGPCNNVLYDVRCGVNRASFSTTTTVATVIDDTNFTVVDDGFADSFLRAGECINTSKTERRSIVDNVANLITVTYPYSNLEVGDSIEMAAGCNHAYGGDCSVTKFNNQRKYVGFPFLPGINPHQGEL